MTLFTITYLPTVSFWIVEQNWFMTPPSARTAHHIHQFGILQLLLCSVTRIDNHNAINYTIIFAQLQIILKRWSAVGKNTSCCRTKPAVSGKICRLHAAVVHNASASFCWIFTLTPCYNNLWILKFWSFECIVKFK